MVGMGYHEKIKKNKVNSKKIKEPKGQFVVQIIFVVIKIIIAKTQPEIKNRKTDGEHIL